MVLKTVLKICNPLFELFQIKQMIIRIKDCSKNTGFYETRLFYTLCITGKAQAGTFFTNANTNNKKVKVIFDTNRLRKYVFL